MVCGWMPPVVPLFSWFREQAASARRSRLSSAGIPPAHPPSMLKARLSMLASVSPPAMLARSSQVFTRFALRNADLPMLLSALKPPVYLTNCGESGGRYWRAATAFIPSHGVFYQ